MFRFAIIVCLFVLTACSKSSAPKSSVHEVTGSSTERVAGVSAIITKHKAPPTAILDAHFVGKQMSVGRPYFDSMVIPIGAVLLFILGVGPALPWGPATKERSEEHTSELQSRLHLV